MKKNAMILLISCLIFSSPVFGQKGKTEPNSDNRNAVEVLYFHYAHRGATCNAVEAQNQKTLKDLYPVQVKAGTISFQSINLEEPEGEKSGHKHKIDGQSLIIVTGGKKEDITEKAFLYALNSPNKLKAEIKKID